MSNVKLKEGVNKLTAFAPATSANLGVGFDILGLALDAVGDKVTLTKRDDGQIIIEKINSVTGLPLEPNKNTASYALQKMCEELDISCGFSMQIDKGIAMGSGMGGSAASAVAAVVALNGFLSNPVSREKLVEYALYGEEIASGGRHADNVAPCVFGGITLIRSLAPMEVINLPYPELYCVIIHPHLQVETKSARGILKPEIPLKKYVEQSAQLGAAICAFYQKDIELLRRSMQDLIIEPQRANLVTGYYQVKEAALKSGAITATFSGSGPSMLAFCDSKANAEKVTLAMLAMFNKHGIEADQWISPINPDGAYIIEDK
ncbi:homoserine kinase [Aquella oligotrophica]|uniref:Homoserine kinase n=1 Tax=Aquella oligotrophica TaxID=2067065 RepID=A0A2I7N8U6_9NEIS|nr:homoserine kinase [Aquella oligotrophica]AUR52876.1 homoserine kinase [Aquella oligotrophica]